MAGAREHLPVASAASPGLPGHVVILNGAPRSGKSSIAAVIVESFEGDWVNLGVDRSRATTPARLQPGIGLRPGGERPDLEPMIPVLYAALYDSVAAHSRATVNVVVDVGHHDAYSRPLHVVRDAAHRLAGLPVLYVGVRCDLATVMRRRDASPTGTYAGSALDGTIPDAVRRWQEAVHDPGVYDLEVDTSELSVAACAAVIRHRLEHGPPGTVFARFAGRET
jgi:chloramphenicol 3-O phosphotransferase